MEFNCGKCVWCKLQRAKEWSVRMLCEYADFKGNGMFLTLTYDDKKSNAPFYNTLVKKDFQLFIKRLRKKYKNLKYLMCGEYGEKNYRPHYHCILLGVNLRDKNIVNEAWNLGKCYFGYVEEKSIMYCVKYLLKGYNKESQAFLDLKNPIHEKPYMDMSKGLGKQYALMNEERLKKEMSIVTVNGTKRSLPRYYRKKLNIIYDDYAKIFEEANKKEKERKEKLGLSDIEYYELVKNESRQQELNIRRITDMKSR